MELFRDVHGAAKSSIFPGASPHVPEASHVAHSCLCLGTYPDTEWFKSVLGRLVLVRSGEQGF